ncbi:MAG: prepilin-type N-terminal cleavage/methylation domain-containing protein, partial [Arenicella sp.]|nr:prepilin-type N-terminal cleavage/methylation domain-containing protein [Arenicella sp.]
MKFPLSAPCVLGWPRKVVGNQPASAQNGFTMIELLITVMMLVVLGAVAAPNFGNAVSNNRLVSQTNDLVAAVSLARQMA